MLNTKCRECDYSESHKWNNGLDCDETRNQPNGTCDNNHSGFILRRDKRSCENCKFVKIGMNCPKGEPLCWPTRNRPTKWEPIITEEKQMKEYKATKKLTLKNLADCVYNKGCNDAGYQFFKMFYEVYLADRNVQLDTDIRYELTESSQCYKFIMEDVERIKFCVGHGFIEEIEKLLSCPVCKTDSSYKRSDGHVVCNKCGTDCKSVKWWNTRK